MLAHSELAEIAGRAYAGKQSWANPLGGSVDLLRRGGEVVVAFPGTHPALLQDWFRDLRVFPVKYPSLGWVHPGFASAATGAFRAEAHYIDRKADLVTISGHSLGGACALLFGAMFAVYRPGQPFRVVTFGAPRVRLFCNRAVPILLKTGDECVNYARRGDIVPHVPLRPLYLHPGKPVALGEPVPGTPAFLAILAEFEDFAQTIPQNHSIQRYRADLIAIGR